MNEFATVSESKTVTGHEIFNKIDYNRCIEYTIVYMKLLPPGSKRYVRFSCH